MFTLLLFAAGLILLTVGAELLVRGASTMSKRFGVPSLIVGLTVVAFGTSAPEMAVSIESALAGQADLALGNVIGSNIFNVLFILGVSALILPLVVSHQLIRLDVPIMVGASLLVWWMARDGAISRLDGLALFLGIIAYTGMQIRIGVTDSSSADLDEKKPPRNVRGFLVDCTLAVTGLALLVLGANWLVDSAVEIARALGVSELIIGLTLVAAGTSLPEVATSIMATIRGERDLAVGNVVGSNLFNLSAVLGISAAVSPSGVAVSPNALAFDLPMMALAAFACLPIFFTGRVINRSEGAAFLFAFIAYTGALILIAQEVVKAENLRNILFVAGATLVFVYLNVLVGRGESRRRGRSPQRDSGTA